MTTFTFLEEPHRSPVNPKGFHSSLRDRLVQEGNQVNRLEMVKLTDVSLVPEKANTGL